MNNFFRAIIAGYGAKKLGGGCFGTIIVFIIIWVALGQCSLSSREVPPPETYPADRRAMFNKDAQDTTARRVAVWYESYCSPVLNQLEQAVIPAPSLNFLVVFFPTAGETFPGLS